jgi:serine/threonine protein kinase
MASKRAVLPALPPPSFPPVSVLPAHRLTGATLVLPDTEISTSDGEHASVLERRSSVAGNVLCVDNKQYFWLQRKIRATSTQGSLRVGFCLKDPGEQKKRSLPESTFEVLVAPKDGAVSNVDKTNEQRVQMVAIRVEDLSDFLDSLELAVLQYISSFLCECTTRVEHIPSSVILAVDSSHVYIVMPYDEVVSLSLFDYCLAHPGAIVSETEAREIFRQILQVRNHLHKCKATSDSSYICSRSAAKRVLKVYRQCNFVIATYLWIVLYCKRL